MARAIHTIEPAAQQLGVPRERWLCYGQYHEVIDELFMLLHVHVLD